MVSRQQNKTGQTDLEFQDSFIYRAILTNDLESSDQEIITKEAQLKRFLMK